jgi:predicted DNA-binding transcriptional regulator YafY
MRLCGAARVVAPTELAEQVRDEAARALAAYTR